MSEFEIVAFVEARLAEEEAAAKAATPGRWVVGGFPGAEYLPCDFVHAPDYRPDGFSWGQHVGDASVADGGMGPWAVSVQGSGFPRANAQHIARWNPARVLREVAAKRLIIDAAFRHLAIFDGEVGCGHTAEQLRAGECPGQDDDIELLLILAAPYVDHPDFKPEWRIE